MQTTMKAFRAWIKENHDKKDLSEILSYIDHYFLPDEKGMLMDFYLQDSKGTLYDKICEFDKIYNND